MNHKQFNKNDVHKNKRIIIIMVTSLLFVAATSAFVYRFIYPVLLSGGFFDNPPSKNEVIHTLNNNKKEFEGAVDYIKTLDPKIFRIDNGANAYLSTGDKSDVSINNRAVDKILKLGIKDIIINGNCIDFFCGGAGREYYTGVIYSDSGNPVGYDGDTSMILSKKGIGWEWKVKDGDNHYYCEKIEGNWYYYQMWF